MNAKTVTAVLLAAFVVFAVIALGWQWFAPPEADSAETPEAGVVPGGPGDDQSAAADASPAAETEAGLSDGVAVYYFHTTFRCATCNKIEAMAGEAVETGFAAQIEAGRLAWQIINVDKPEHKHYREEFELHAATLVMVEMRDGERARWKSCEKVWELVHDPEAFTAYVTREVRDYLDRDPDHPSGGISSEPAQAAGEAAYSEQRAAGAA